MHPASHPRPRRGFTLVELLVVIGIIVVLLVIVAVGLHHTRSLAGRQGTQVQLKICEDMLTEYRRVNGYKNILGPADSVVTGTPIRLPSAWIAGQYNSPIFIYPKNNGSTEVTAQVNNPVSALTFVNFRGSEYGLALGTNYGNFSRDEDPNNPRWVADVVRWTQGVMYILLKDPGNRALIGALPPTQLLESPPPSVSLHGDTIGQAPPHYTIDAALPVDAWRNPIIFVPPGGMHVWMSLDGQLPPLEYVVRSSGVYRLGNLPPVGPADRPFFASAGQDGSFTTTTVSKDLASDNIYSFDMK